MRRLVLGFTAMLALGCGASEAPRVELEVIADGSGLVPVTTDLGWTVTLDEARVAFADLVFTTAGEVHERAAPELGASLLGLVLAHAHAHPGHFQGGEVIGELPGDHLFDPNALDPSLGRATLIVGDYTAVDFELRRADELDPSDPLAGHTAWLSGTARRDELEIAFTVAIDSPIGRVLVGAPCELSVAESDAADGIQLGFRVLTEDTNEGDTLFDGLDFAGLDEADGTIDGRVALVDPELDPGQSASSSDAYNLLRRTFQTHDHFDVIAREP